MIEFNIPTLTGREKEYILQALEQPDLSGAQNFSQKCEEWLQNSFDIKRAYLVPSGTHALEMAALLIDIKPGDEVIMPSYTYPSTANAFVLRGAQIVFVDIDPGTMNITPENIIEAYTPETRALVPVHYGGVACDMDAIMNFAEEKKIYVIEDAAQGVDAKYGDKYLGSIGHIGCFSFHESKNYHCGEGGAILINEEHLFERAEILREKGTNRTRFLKGEVDKYSWTDIGSSFLLGELPAAFLYAQLSDIGKLTQHRLSLWNRYYSNLIEIKDKAGLPGIPETCRHNGHIFYLKLNNKNERHDLIEFLSKNGVKAVFHYIPLHDTEPGKLYGRFSGEMNFTNTESKRLLRLPMHNGLTVKDVDYICELIKKYFNL